MNRQLKVEANDCLLLKIRSQWFKYFKTSIFNLKWSFFFIFIISILKTNTILINKICWFRFYAKGNNQVISIFFLHLKYFKTRNYLWNLNGLASFYLNSCYTLSRNQSNPIGNKTIYICLGLTPTRKGRASS